MSDAISDPSHTMTLGYALGALLVLWVNFRLARWVLGKLGGAGPAHKENPQVKKH
jgi:hypothetical protein